MSNFWENDLEVIFADDFAAVDGTWNGKNVRILFDSEFRYTNVPVAGDVSREPVIVYVRKSEVPSPKHGDAVILLGRTFFAGVIEDDQTGMFAVSLWRERS